MPWYGIPMRPLFYSFPLLKTLEAFTHPLAVTLIASGVETEIMDFTVNPLLIKGRSLELYMAHQL